MGTRAEADQAFAAEHVARVRYRAGLGPTGSPKPEGGEVTSEADQRTYAVETFARVRADERSRVADLLRVAVSKVTVPSGGQTAVALGNVGALSKGEIQAL